jgi:hypothetical protein
MLGKLVTAVGFVSLPSTEDPYANDDLQSAQEIQAGLKGLTAISQEIYRPTSEPTTTTVTAKAKDIVLNTVDALTQFSRGATALSAAPVDPNDIFGPQGFGTPHFVTPDQTFPYTILYENKASATAPALVVKVSQQLDARLDWTTFELGDFGFGPYIVHVPAGRRFYSTRIDATATRGVFVDVTADFDPTTGVATWTYSSVDPKTGALPTGATDGFLPPDDNAGSGEGFVNYRVKLKAGAATGTTINAKATVFFDAGLPDQSSLDTPQFTNTIDAAGPASTVTALPATEPPIFMVSWSGQDDAGGSGIAFYNVYVSDNGGPFQAWLTATPLTTAVFNGLAGHTYAFFCTATDNVGNTPALPVGAQATTTIVPLPSVTLQPVEQAGFAGTLATFQAAATGTPSPTVQWQLSSDGVLFTDIPGATSPTYTFPIPAGPDVTWYQAVFTNANGSVPTTAVTLTVTPDLAILAGPTSQVVVVGQKATFTAQASGITTPKLQWQVSGDDGLTYSNIPGATRSKLVITASAATNGNLYRAVFTNLAGVAASPPAALTVSFALPVGTRPQALTVAPGMPVTLTAVTKGSPIQWFVSTNKGKTYTAISGATLATLSLTPQLSDNGSLYQAVLTTTRGPVKTGAVTLTVDTPPTVTAGPTDQTVIFGLAALFTASAGGTPKLSVQWQVSSDDGNTWTAIKRATGTTLILKKVGFALDGTRYRVVFTNGAGQAFSNAATLTVN